MTQAQLSDATGINQAMICRIEKHDYTPSIDQLQKLGKVLDFEVTDLFIEETADCSKSMQTGKNTIYSVLSSCVN